MSEATAPSISQQSSSALVIVLPSRTPATPAVIVWTSAAWAERPMAAAAMVMSRGVPLIERRRVEIVQMPPKSRRTKVVRYFG